MAVSIDAAITPCEHRYSVHSPGSGSANNSPRGPPVLGLCILTAPPERQLRLAMHWNIAPKTILSSCAALLGLATLAPAQQFVEFEDEILLQTTNWSDTLTVSKFDPDLGNLLSVGITLEADTLGTAAFESSDAQASVVTLNFEVSITLDHPTNMMPLAAASPSVMTVDNATAFDGTIDFGGTSGVTHPNLAAMETDSATLTPPGDDVSDFVGMAGNPGTVSLPVRAIGNSSGSGAGNLALMFSAMAGAKVTVRYNYAPDCNMNMIPDNEDIENGTSDDCNNNGIPDECEDDDCDNDGILDVCEPDCNNNGIPDDCDKLPCSECRSINRRVPGSLLLYPEFDSRMANVTVLTLTNTNCEFTGDALTDNVAVEFVYIEKDTCSEFNTTTILTPCDTLTLLVEAHNPNQDQGYVYAFAKSPQTGEPIVYNHLIGQTLIINGFASFEYATNAVAFKGIGDGTITDLDADGIRDLDGVEYDEAPEEILIPRFFGQDYSPNQGGPTMPNPRATHSELILVNLSGGAAFTTTVDFLIYNDNEEVFSAEYTFECWDKPYLLDISGLFANAFLKTTNHDPLEILGAPGLEAGWIRINGGIAQSSQIVIQDPAFYAVLVERIGPFAAADLPFELCSQNNGDLLPRSLLGDN